MTQENDIAVARGQELLEVLDFDEMTVWLFDIVDVVDQKRAVSLIREGADLTVRDAHGATALIRSCLYGLEDAALAIVEKGADINVQNNGFATPLIYACTYGTPKMIHALLDARANVLLQDKNGCDALYYLRKRQEDDPTLVGKAVRLKWEQEQVSHLADFQKKPAPRNVFRNKP